MSFVDNRIVQMLFDNKQFESGIQTSLDSLNQLDKSIHATGSSTGMGGLATAVETVQARFSAMQIVAITALTNITNSAINTGKRLLSSLTIDPVKTGLSEYETQINAVQTILANTESKGTTLDQVNTALDTLNAYADKTIYNFTEMTRNIGTFTAAGVDLDTSVNAIQGIANLAAVSGSTSQQASTAMYQLSQALSSGTVKLMDWNSVVNAGMGGQVFQDALKETARVSGVAIDDLIDKHGSFRETLSTGWLTAEILTDTLQKFTMTTEGLTEAEIEQNRVLLKNKGYTDEQIEAIFKLGDTATQAATKVKTFTQLLDTTKEAAQSGWTQSWEIVVGDFEEAKLLWTDVSNVLNEIIGASANARNEMLQTWKDLGGRTALIESLRNAFHGLVNVVKPIKESFREFFPRTTGQQLLDITNSFKAMTESFKKWTENAGNIDKLKRTFSGLFAVVGIGVDLIKAIARGFADIIGFVAPAGNGVLTFTASIGDALVALRNFLKTGNVFGKTVGKITTVLGKVINGVKMFVVNIAEAFKAFSDIDTTALDEFGEKVQKRFEPLTKLGEGVKKVFMAIAAVFKKVAPVFLALASLVGKAFGALGDAITGAIGSGNFSDILDVINSILAGGIIVAIKKFIDSLTGITENVGGALESFVNIFDGVGDCLKAWQSQLKANTLIKIASAIAILAAALVVLSMIDSDKLLGAMTAISALFIEMFASMTIFSKLANGKGFSGMTKASFAMIGLSTAVLILSVAMGKLAKLDWAGIGKGLVGVAGLAAILVVAANSMEKSSKNLKKSAGGMIAMGIAILILASAVEKLGALNIGSLTKGLIGVGVLCAELALFMKSTNLEKMGMSKGIGLLLLATAMNVLAGAVGKFASLNVASLTKGLTAVAVVLAELAIFTKATGNAKKVVSTATGLTILGAAMLIFAKAIADMGSLSIGQIGKGLLTMAGALTILVVAMKMIPKSIVFTSTSVVVLASALLILGEALENMGGMSLAEIGKSLLVLAASLTILATAMSFMTTAIAGASALMIMATALAILAPVLDRFGSMSLGEIGKSLLTLAGVFAIFGAAAFILAPITPIMLALGGAIALLGVGCAAVGVGLLAFAAGLSSLAVAGTAGAAALVVVIMSIIGLIPAILTAIGEGIIAICKVIAGSADAICDALATVVVALSNALIRSVPQLVVCLGVLLDSLLTFIVNHVPKIVDAGMKLIIGLLQGIANNIHRVVSSAVSVVVAFLNSLGTQLPRIVDAGFKMIINFIDGVTSAIKTNIPRLTKSAKELGFAIIDGMTGGLASKVKNVADKAAEMAKKALNAAKKVLGINSPSKEFEEVGMYSDEGLAYGLKKFAGVVSKSATNVGKTAIDSLNKSMVGITNAVDGEIDTSLTIRPVIDMTNIEEGSKLMHDLFGGSEVLTVEYANNKATSISGSMNSHESATERGSSNQNGTSISFTQNNYSPKALSKTDIYRQTKNQFSMMKGALNKS